jgi:AraC family transcriptional regulator
MIGLPCHAEFYRNAYSFPQQHRTIAGARLFAAPHREPGDFLEPPVSSVTLQLSRSPRSGLATLDLGAGRFQVDLRTPCFVVAPAGQSCSYVLPVEISLLVVEIPAEAFEGHAEANRDLGRLHAGRHHDPLPMLLAERLWTLPENSVSRLEADSLLSALATLLVQVSYIRPPQRQTTGGLAPWQLRRVTDHMGNHLDRDVTLAELAALVGLSPHHFCRAFATSTGLPPHRWLVERRVERAKEMMAAHPRLGLTEVALAVGYAGQSALATAFRRVTGTTPSAWRRQVVR